MPDYIKISGQTSSGLVIGAGTELEIGSGGTALDTLITDGGYEIVSAGGVTVSSTVRAGGYELVSSGGTASATGIKDGGYLEVSSGGVAISAAVSAGGTLIVSAGGSDVETGSATAAVVMVTSLVQSGQTVSGLVIGSDTVLEVVGGGTALSTTVTDGGKVIIFSGGIATATIVQSSGFMAVSSGAAITATTVESGGSLTLQDASMAGTVLDSGATGSILLAVSSGVSSSGLILNSVTSANVFAGGTATGTLVNSGGSEQIFAGGTEVSAVIAGGGFDLISGVSIDPIISGSAAVTGVVSGGTIFGSGSLSTEQAPLAVGAVSNVTVAGSGVVTLLDGQQLGGSLTFAGSGGLVIDDSTMPFATLSGFGSGNSIALDGVPYESGSETASFQNGSLIIAEGSQDYVLQLSGNYAADGFALTSGSGGTVVTLAGLSCFAAGTFIATPRGPTPVEQLRAGDTVLTAAGEDEPIIWVGGRHVDCRRHPEPALIRPVRIRAHAFAPGRPGRDLYLSPDHAIFAEDVLVPVKHLVNGTTVVQIAAETVSYHHLELPRHGVILAENLPVESYLDTGDRCGFAEPGGATLLHPVFGRESPDVTLIQEALGCAPMRVTGPEVDRIRAALARPAGERTLPAAGAS